METIRFAERRKVSKWPAIIVTCFLILGGCFVAYAINFEDNPKMLGFSGEVAVTESDGLEEVGLSDAEKLEQIMNLNYEIKDVSSTDSTSANFISDIHVPTIYVDGKEVEEINTKIKEEYDQRFAALKEQMIKAEGKYSFNVTYTYFENIVGLKKIVSLVVKQQIIDRDSQKVTSEKMTVYNVDLSARTTVTQQEIALEIFGKDYKEILKKQVKNYIVSKGYVKESEYKYEITGLENFYIQEGKFHIVFNGESDGITNKAEVIDIVIENL
jgi:hypothetical protein